MVNKVATDEDPHDYSEKIKDMWKTASLPNSATVISSGLAKMSVLQSLRLGAKLRDEIFIQYPLIPEAIFIYSQIVSSREWALGGKPEAVFKALDFVNNAQSKNTETGLIEYGYSSFLRRRVLDHLLVGRTTFAIDTRNKVDSLYYIDPVRLMWDRLGKSVSKAGVVKPVSKKEKSWVYDGKRYSSEDIMVSHPVPIGANRFVSPIAWMVPTANLAWLIREHNSASLDGRRLRDILLVSNASFRNALEEALIQSAQLWDGGDVSEIGIPVVEITNMSGTPIKDLFAMVGLSNIPESLDQERFMFQYANEISGTVGLALRHFWSDDRNTNRALEEVQEARQQQKGPAAFIRNEQRLMNNSGFLERVAGDEVRFGFLEETDAATLNTKAEVLKAYGEAALSFKAVFGASLTIQSFMAWMKRIGALPLDIELSDEPVAGQEDDPEDDPNGDDISHNEENQLLEEGEEGLSGETEVVSMGKDVEYGHVVVDQNGYVIDRRAKIFSFPDIKSLLSEQYLEQQKERSKEILSIVETGSAYADGKEVDEVESVLDYQHHKMAVDGLSLLHNVGTLTEADKSTIVSLRHKSSFNMILSSDEQKIVEKLCSLYEVSVIDTLLKDGIQ